MIAVDDSQHSLISLQIFTEQFWPLLQVILVDLVLAGDNAIIIALVAASVPTSIRQRVIWIGIAGAALMRIAFALVTVQLLEITGLLLAGGLVFAGIRSVKKVKGPERAIAQGKEIPRALKGQA